MPYQGFWGLAALSLVLLGHAVYCMVTATKGKKLRPLPKRQRLLLSFSMVVCGAALGGGVVMMLCRADEAVIYVMGLVLLLSSFWLNSRVRRCLPEMIEEEE